MLREIEKTPFFQAARFDTIVGTFALPTWGGNRDYAGWHMLGFEHQPRFQAPFGYYDADVNRKKLMVQPARPAARFRPSDAVDFVIVGSGAAGGIIAKELSTAGFSVVVLEQGPRLTEARVRSRRVRHVHAEQATSTIPRRSRRRSAPRRRTRPQRRRR